MRFITLIMCLLLAGCTNFPQEQSVNRPAEARSLDSDSDVAETQEQSVNRPAEARSLDSDSDVAETDEFAAFVRSEVDVFQILQSMTVKRDVLAKGFAERRMKTLALVGFNETLCDSKSEDQVKAAAATCMIDLIREVARLEACNEVVNDLYTLSLATPKKQVNAMAQAFVLITESSFFNRRINIQLSK